MFGAHSKDGLIIPINVTQSAIAEAANHTYSISSTKTDIVLSADCTNFLIVPDVIPTTPMYIKFGFGSVATATTTSFDVKLSECYPALHLQVFAGCTHLSIIAASGTQVLTITQYKG